MEKKDPNMAQCQVGYWVARVFREMIRLQRLDMSFVYPPNIVVDHRIKEIDPGTSVYNVHEDGYGYICGEYNSRFIVRDDELLAVPSMNELVIYPYGLASVINDQFDIDSCDAYELFLLKLIHTIIHEMVHHYDATSQYEKYQRVMRTSFNWDEKKEAFNRFIGFVDSMQSEQRESIVEDLTCQLFKPICQNIFGDNELITGLFPLVSRYIFYENADALPSFASSNLEKDNLKTINKNLDDAMDAIKDFISKNKLRSFCVVASPLDRHTDDLHMYTKYGENGEEQED